MRAILTILVLLVAARAHAAAPAQQLSFAGNAHFAAAELLQVMDGPFDAHGKLDQDVFERDLLRLSAFYWDRGYALVKIHEPVITPTQIIVRITEGERFTLGNLAITGDPPPRARARHRASLAIQSGHIFSRTALAAERERLARYYQERGYAYVNVLPLTTVDLAKQTIAVTFEIQQGKLTRIERAELACPAIPRADLAVAFAAGDLYNLATIEASKQGIAELGAVSLDRVVVSTRRGTTDARVVVRVECP